MKHTFTLAVILLTLALSSTAARADSIAVTLDQPVQTVVSSVTTISFFGTIAADPSDIGDLYFNGDNFSLDPLLTIDDSGLFFNFPYPISAGVSVDSVIFTIGLPGNEPLGAYLGSFSILGGSDGNATDILGTVDFEIDNVSSSPGIVPEPSTLLLFGTGLTTIAGGCKRKWRPS
jgi:PEP-CTERM motif